MRKLNPRFLFLEPLEDRTLLDTAWQAIAGAFNSGIVSVTNNISKTPRLAESAFNVSIPLMPLTNFAQALDLTTKLQTPFLEKVSQALLTLDPNNMGSARGYLTAQGFTVEQLDVNPVGRGDLIRLSEDVTFSNPTARLIVGGPGGGSAPGQCDGLGFCYFDLHSNGGLGSQTIQPSVQTISFHVAFGVDLDTNMQPQFYLRDSTPDVNGKSTGIDNFTVTAQAHLSGKMNLNHLLGVSVSGDASISLTAGITFRGDSSHKLRPDDLIAKDPTTGLLKNVIGNLSGSVQFGPVPDATHVVQFKTKLISFLPDALDLTWTGKFTATIATDASGKKTVTRTETKNLPDIWQTFTHFVNNVFGMLPNLDFLQPISSVLNYNIPILDETVGQLVGLGKVSSILGLAATISQNGGDDAVKQAVAALQRVYITVGPVIEPDGTSKAVSTMADLTQMVQNVIDGKAQDLLTFSLSGGDQIKNKQICFTFLDLSLVKVIDVKTSFCVGGSLSWDYEVDLGLDTTGFYIGPNTHIGINGEIHAGIQGTVSLLGLVDLSMEAGVGVGAGARLGLHNPDPTQGARIYLDEIFDGGSASDVLTNIINAMQLQFTINVTFHLEASVTLLGFITFTVFSYDWSLGTVADLGFSFHTTQTKRKLPLNLMDKDLTLDPLVSFDPQTGFLTLTGTGDGSSGTKLNPNSVALSEPMPGIVQASWLGHGFGLFGSAANPVKKVIFKDGQSSGDDSLRVRPGFTIPIDATGGSGNNYFEAGDGDSTLRAGNGNSTLIGGAGNDWLVGGAGNDSLQAGGGDSTLIGGSGSSTLIGGAGNDSLCGTGNDTVCGGKGRSVIRAGNGRNTFSTLVGGGGDATLYGGSGPGCRNLLIGGLRQDGSDASMGTVSIHGGSCDSTIWAGGGNDTIVAGTGNDVIHGGGNSKSADFIFAGDTSDPTMINGGGRDTIYAGSGSNSIRGGAGDDLIYGAPENLITKDSNGKPLSFDPSVTSLNTIQGGKGNDTIYGGPNSDLLIAGTGNDALFSFSKDRSQKTTLIAGPGEDSLYAGRGDDLIRLPFGVTNSGSVRSHFFGGPRLVTLAITTDASNSHILLARSPQYPNDPDTFVARNPDTGSSFTFTIPNDLETNYIPVLALEAIQGNNLLEVDPAVHRNVKLIGGTGNDTLKGGGGTNSLMGGTGNDLLIGGPETPYIDGKNPDGTDRVVHPYNEFHGGKGNTTMDGSNSVGDDIFYGGTGDNDMRGGSGNIIMYGGNSQAGQHNHDVMKVVGNQNATVIMIGGHNDATMYGGPGRNVLSGGTGNNEMHGGGTDDVITRGSGSDTIYGGPGYEVLIGGRNPNATDVIYAADPTRQMPHITTEDYVHRLLILTQQIVDIGLQVLYAYCPTHPDDILPDPQHPGQMFACSNRKPDHVLTAQEIQDLNDRLQAAAVEAQRTGQAYTDLSAEYLRGTGNRPPNVLIGGDGPTTIYGTNYPNFILAGAGAMTFYSGGADDTVTGAAGKDTFFVRPLPDNSTITFTAVQDSSGNYIPAVHVVAGSVDETEMVHVRGISQIGAILGAGTNTVSVALGGHTIPGLDGINIKATSGNDTVDLGDFPGSATVQAGSGIDSVLFAAKLTGLELDGGTGQSTYEVDGTDVTIQKTADGSALLLTNGGVQTRITKDTFSRFLIQSKSVAGQKGHLVLGPTGNFTLPGLIAKAGAGDDLLDAHQLTQAVTLVGGSGHDTLTGGSGPNYLQGGLGNGILNLKRGDIVLGGGGNDQFQWTDTNMLRDNWPIVTDLGVAGSFGTGQVCGQNECHLQGGGYQLDPDELTSYKLGFISAGFDPRGNGITGLDYQFDFQIPIYTCTPGTCSMQIGILLAQGNYPSTSYYWGGTHTYTGLQSGTLSGSNLTSGSFSKIQGPGPASPDFSSPFSMGFYLKKTNNSGSGLMAWGVGDFNITIHRNGGPHPATSFRVTPSMSSPTAGVVDQVTVTALDAAGQQIAGYKGTVHFTNNDSTVSLPDYTFNAAENGVHTFPVTFKTAGQRTLSVVQTDASFATGMATVNVVPAAAAHFQMTPSANPPIAGSPFQLTVTAQDQFSNVATSYRGTVHFTSTDPQWNALADYTFTAADNGVHTFTTVILKTAGSQTLTASSAGIGSGSVTGEFSIPTANSVPSGITAGPDGNLWFTESGGTGKIGKITPAGVIAEYATGLTLNSQPWGITAGPDGNLWFGEEGASQVGRITPDGALTEFPTLTSSSGPVGITAGLDGSLWFVEKFANNVGRITAVPLTASATVNVLPGLTARYAVAATALDPDIAGTPFTVTVTAQDSYGNTVTGYQGSVDFTSTDAAATLPGHYTFTADDQGAHTFSGVILRTAGSESVSATGPGGIIPGSITTNVVALHFAVSTSAANPDVAGTPFTVTVTALDSMGHTATGYTGTVHFTSSDNLATLPADYSFTAGDNGVHTFTDVVLRRAGSSGSVTATDTVTNLLTGSATVTVVATVAVQFAVSTSAANPDIAGTPFDVTVTAQDLYRNTVTSYTGTVHFSSADPYRASLPDDYTFQAADQGVHTFAAGATLYTARTTTIGFANGFADHSSLRANGSTTFPGTPAVLRLTDGGGREASSAWYNSPVGLGAFTTTFILRDTGSADGVSFVIQADPRGQAALGDGGGGEGYAGIVNSIAIKFDLYTHNTHNPSTGLFTGGQSPDSDPTKDVLLTGINLGSGDPIQVTLIYDGTGTLTDTRTR